MKNKKTLRKRLLFVPAFAFACLFPFVSCSDDDSATTEASKSEETNYHISPSEAGELAQEFMEGFQQLSTRASSVPVTVAGVEALRSMQTRSNGESSDSLPIDTLLYFVNYANNNGFAVIAADRRTDPILAIIDEGSYSPDSLQDEDNEGFLDFLDDAVCMELEDIENYTESPTQETRAFKYNNGWTVSNICHPILKTKWGQKEPYNYFCRLNGKKCKTGCVITAVAQILAYFKNLPKVSWTYNSMKDSTELHWDRILSSCNKGVLSNNSDATSRMEVAKLMRFLGVAFQAKYGTERTSASSGTAIKWIQKYSGLSATDLKGYDESEIIKGLDKGNPIYACAFSKKKKVLGVTVDFKGGHAWIFDGYCKASKEGKEKILFHCNWGWNACRDGYYVSGTFNPKQDPEICEEIDSICPMNANNYRYKKKFSVITRKTL